MAKNQQPRKKQQNKGHLDLGLIMGMTMITIVFLVLFIGMQRASHRISVQNEKYRVQKEELQQQIKDEELRAIEIEGLKDYVDSESYIEQVARDKLGLVYPDEILFKAE